MEFVLLLALIVGAPIVIVGLAQFLLWKLAGDKVLTAVAAVVVLICIYLLLAEAFAPPVYGNKSGLIGLGIFAIAVLMIENLAIVCLPLIRRYLAWDRAIQSRAADHSKINSGKNV